MPTTELRSQMSDGDLQAYLLAGVSRTFALTIPQLPPELSAVVANAYLLCRIVDTIEDETTLSADQKRAFGSGFIDVLKNGASADAFARRLAPKLSGHTIPAEHQLVRNIPRVLRMTRRFDADQQAALARCVDTMAAGMSQFQARELKGGLKNIHALDRYCYHVAGCVGEMLTTLFCHYSPEIERHAEGLFARAVSFGQGLQLTNIVKDIWDDHQRGVCWLPRDIFDRTGYDLNALAPGRTDKRFQAGLLELVHIAHGHLKNALDYTLLIPATETGIRHFCLWALGMAVLTLQKIRKNPGFSRSAQVKISHRSVRATILASKVGVSRDNLLRLFFKAASHGL